MKSPSIARIALFGGCGLALNLAAAGVMAQQTAPAAAAARPPAPKAADTEIYTPVPPTVTPAGGPFTPPPSDAIVLFDGTNLDQWVTTSNKSPAKWTVADGILTVNKSSGNIETKQKFGSYQLHVEWRTPVLTIDGQDRGNSGVFLASTGNGDAGYELQIMDSYNNPTYVNGQAGSIYKQSIPLANPALPPGQWQTYDIVWTEPTFNADGSLKSPAKATVFFNGVLVDNDFVLTGETTNVGVVPYKAYDKLPIKLQAHGDPSPPISYRNIWVRPL